MEGLVAVKGPASGQSTYDDDDDLIAFESSRKLASLKLNY
jgi:hypothetical protein